MINIDYSLFTNCGKRDVNEDRIAFTEKNGCYCFVLCDGLGGHGKGDLASAFVTEFVLEYFNYCKSVDEFFEDVLDKAQSGLLYEQKKLAAKFSMKTTAVILVIYDGKYRYAHIGDSRLYVFKKGKIAERTIDHSVPQMLVMAGDIKEKNIRSHPDRNKLLRVMGDTWGNSKYETSEEYPLKENNAFLLCSDGFWEPVTEKDMIKTFKKCDTASEWLNNMATIAQKNGMGKNMDNFSAIAVICS